MFFLSDCFHDGGRRQDKRWTKNQDKPFWFVKADVAKPCLKLSALLRSLSETEPERRSPGMKSRNEMKVKRDVSCTSTLHYSELRGAESNPLDFRAD